MKLRTTANRTEIAFSVNRPLRIFCTTTIDRQIPDPDFHVKKSSVLQLKSQLVIQLYGNFLTCQKLAPPFCEF